MENSNQRKILSAVSVRLAGIYLIHLSIAVIIIAAAIGYFRGWSFSLKMEEGQIITELPWPQNAPQELKKIGLRCEKIAVDYYEDGRSSDFQTVLTIGDGRDVYTARPVTVNNPLSYKGFNIYLASYGATPAKYFLKVKKKGKILAMTIAEEGAEFEMGDFQIKFLRIEENAEGFGPAIKFKVSEGKRSQEMWVFQAIEQMKKKNPRLFKEMPLMDPSFFKPYLFSLSEDEPRRYVVLKIARDPGVAVAASGGIGLIIGIFLAFIFSGTKNSRRQDIKKPMAAAAEIIRRPH